MSRSRESSVYEGELFFGESKLKTWEPVCTGTVVVSLSGGTVFAIQGEEKVWQYKVEPSLKCRVKDSFVQWQIKGPDGPLSYGMRLKTSESAQKFLDAMTGALADVQNKSVSEPQTVLKVILPGKETTSISAPKSMTMSQLWKLIAQRRRLDPLQYSLALPPDSPHVLSVPCQPQSTVGALKGAEVHVVRNSSQLANGTAGVNQSTVQGSLSLRGGGEMKRVQQPADRGMDGGSSAGGSEQTIMLQVELPKGERMAVRVNTNEPLPEVLKCLCEMKVMNPDNYMFDLPSTMVVADKTLQQLATNKVKIVPRGKDSRKALSDSPTLGPKSGPPPPPPGGTSKRAPPPLSFEQQQQEPVGQRGRSGSLDSPLLSRKGMAAPPVPKGNSKVQPDLVKELSLRLQKGNVGTVGTEETDASIEVPLTDDLEFDGDRPDLTGAKTQGRISSSISVDGLSDRSSQMKKQDVDVETSSGRTALRRPMDDESTAGGFSRQEERQGRYHSTKKKPVKIPEQDSKLSTVGQPSDPLKQDVLSVLLGDPSKKRANLGQIGDTLRQEAVVGERNDPTRRQANLGQAEAGELGKQLVKTVAASVKQQQPERQESLILGAKVPEDVERPGHVQEPSTQPVGGGKPADLPADGAGSAGDKYSSLKRKPRTAAPPPPVVSDKTSSAPPTTTTSQQQPAPPATVDQKKAPPTNLVERSKSGKEQGTVGDLFQGDQQKPVGSLVPSSVVADKTAHRVPARPAPARPAPARPAPVPPKQQNVSKPPALSVSSAVAPLVAEVPHPDKTPHPVTTTLATSSPSEAPPGRSPNSLRRGGTLVSTYSREDGGKVLIVRQSPVLGRAVPGKVVFNFPPPPPPSSGENRRAATGGPDRTRGGAFTSPTRSDTSDDDTLLSPTKTNTSVEITNLDDVMSSSTDEGEGRLALGVGSPQELQSRNGSGTEAENAGEEGPPTDSPDVDPDSDDGLSPGESEDGNGPGGDGPPSLPPPSDFGLMPPEPVFDFEDDGDSVDGEGGGIVLLSIKPSDLVDDIPPPEVPSAGFVPHDAAELLLPPPPAHYSGISPPPPLTQHVMLAPPPPSVFGALPSNVPPPVPPPPPLVKAPSSLSTPAPPSSSASQQPSPSSLLGKAPLPSTTAGLSTPSSPLPLSFARHPVPPQAITDHPTPPPPSIFPLPTEYPTPPPLRALDTLVPSANGGQLYSPLDSPTLVPLPIDSPMDSPSGLYQTGSLTLLDPPSIPESWQPDHLSFISPPPDSSPPNSPVLAAPSSPIPPPPPPLSFGSKTPAAPQVKPKTPAAMRLKQTGGPFSEGGDYAGNKASQPSKHPLSVKSRVPLPASKWKSLDEGDVQDELLSKLQERKAKLKEPATTSLPLASGAQTITSQGGGESMQAQLQMLQQQMLQQQMMQLQQQFQQLQMVNMGYGGVPPMGAGIMYYQPAVGGANPALLPMGAQPGGMAFPLGYMPHGGVGPSAGAPPLGMPPFGMVGIPSQSAVAPPTSLLGGVPGYPMMTPGVMTQPAMAPDEGLLQPRQMSRDELARSVKLGKLEDKFDDLMTEVRETDPSLVLKKAPVPEEREPDSGSPYAGMAAALADALKQRRKHLTEKVASVPDHDAHEWGSSP